MNNQFMSHCEQPTTPILMNEKLPGIDKLAKLEQNTRSPNSAIVHQQQAQGGNNANQISAAYLPPPSIHSHAYNHNSYNMVYQQQQGQHLSPPLTPAVSPSSILYDSINFKRKFSVDVGPFAFGSATASALHAHLSDDAQEAYRRSSCSAVSMNSCEQSSANYSTSNAQHQPHQQQQTEYAFLHNESLQSFEPPLMTNTVTSPTNMTFDAANTISHNGINDHDNETKPHSVSRKNSRAQLTGPAIQHKHVCKYPYCSWSFKRYEHLKRHMLVHTGKRPHVCHYPGCGKSFSRSDNFHAHYRTHTKKASLLQQQALTGSSSSATTGARRKSSVKSASAGQVGTEVNGNGTHATMTSTMHVSPPSAGLPMDHQPHEAGFASPTYYIKQEHPNNQLDISSYHHIYAARGYLPENAHVYQSQPTSPHHAQQQHHSQQQQHYMRQFGISHATVSDLPDTSGVGVPSLLNHELNGQQQHQQHQPFYATTTTTTSPSTTHMVISSPEHDRFGYPVTPITPTSYQSIIHHQHQHHHGHAHYDTAPRDDYDYHTYPMHHNASGSDTSSSIAAVAAAVAAVPTGISTTSSSSAEPASGTKSTKGQRKGSSANNCNNNIKSHTCPVTQCQRRFKRLEHLKRHMRIHTLERPFACTFPNCQKTFSRSDNLSQHMKTHQRVEDRRRKQHYQKHHTGKKAQAQATNNNNMHMNHHHHPQQEQQQSTHSNSATLLSNLVGGSMSWQSTNAATTGAVGC